MWQLLQAVLLRSQPTRRHQRPNRRLLRQQLQELLLNLRPLLLRELLGPWGRHRALASVEQQVLASHTRPTGMHL